MPDEFDQSSLIYVGCSTIHSIEGNGTKHYRIKMLFISIKDRHLSSWSEDIDCTHSQIVMVIRNTVLYLTAMVMLHLIAQKCTVNSRLKKDGKRLNLTALLFSTDPGYFSVAV